MNRSDPDRQAAQVASIIRSAFPIFPIPQGHRRPDGISDYEVDDDVQKFHGRMWTEISIEHWYRCVSPSFIRFATSSEFFNYYLPSLLVAVMQSDDYLHMALDALLPTNPKNEPRAEWKAFRTSLSVEQAEAIVAFLEWVKESSPPESGEWHGADAGLSGLWN
ncbi:DUF6714 family protein [Cupriavidus sp. 2SB]|uniref:DUF6714 family protein n=1 Tax=Cupriavidus sp. 2SB TaxID=2502199 RepID=UPI0010F60CCD|nr:DUF6714 family protein [Cupriavidus sp. 2SB]